MDEIASIYQAGGIGANGLARYTTSEKLARDRAAIDGFAASGNRLRGRAVVTAFKVQAADLVSGAVTAYACVDVSRTTIRNAAGKDVTPKERPDRQALVIGFVRGPLINSSESWSGSGVC